MRRPALHGLRVVGIQPGHLHARDERAEGVEIVADQPLQPWDLAVKRLSLIWDTSLAATTDKLLANLRTLAAKFA